MNRSVPSSSRDAVGGIGSAGDVGRKSVFALRPLAPTERKPLRDAVSAAALKLERDRDAKQAMKDHEAARQATLAKTARLRAERLARDAKVASAPKLRAAKKK